MKNIILSLWLVATAAVLLFMPHSPALAESITLTEDLAAAISNADIKDSEGNSITATLVSADTVSLDADIADVAVIDFTPADLSNITSGDFESFDQFTGLEELTIALPDAFTGEFLPSFDKLSVLDVSGSTAEFILSLYNTPNIVSVNAANCSNLKAVNIALVETETLSSDNSGSSSGIASLFSASKSELLSKPLASLETLNLSNNPKLDRMGYAIASGTNSMFGGMGGGSGSGSGSGGGLSSMFGGGSHDPVGYKTHTVITALRKNTVYYNEDMSYSASSGFNITQLLSGGSGNEITTYTGEIVDLLPALKNFSLKGSGTDNDDYISFIDIPELNSLVSGDFSGMTRLNYITLPSGTTLKNLNLTGDSALLKLDLSETRGLIWPEGFRTLTGLVDFIMAGRSEIDSIDLGTFAKLETLDVNNDSLESLDLDANKSLQSLLVANNRINSLNLGNHTALSRVDVRNNRLVKIDLTKNINIHVNPSSAENSPVSLSPQTRYMAGNRPLVFSFRELGMTSLEFANVVADSVKGEGVSAADFDPLSGTVKFTSLPSVVNYDYMSGIYSEADSKPVCMSVRLVWDVSGRKPAIIPETSEISGAAHNPITPVTITADSEQPVTWTLTPSVLPDGLIKTERDWTLTISGEPSAAYSGIFTVTASNGNGESEPATVSVDIAAYPQSNVRGVSSSGCYAGNMSMAVIALALFLKRRH